MENRKGARLRNFSKVLGWITAGVFALGPFAMSVLPAFSADIPIQVPVTAVAQPSASAEIPLGSKSSGSPVPLVISGLDPFQFVQIFVQSEPVLVASGFADAKGVYKTQLLLPAGLEAGTHTISAVIKRNDGTTTKLVVKKFSVSSSGLLQKYSGSDKSPTPSPSNSGSANGGGSNSGSTDHTPTATAQPSPSDQQQNTYALGHQLYFGGPTFSAAPAWSLNQNPARISISVFNNTAKTVKLAAQFRVQNLFGVQIAQVKQFTFSVPSRKNTEVSRLISDVGQWGLYTAITEVEPKSQIEGATFNKLSRQQSVWVWPLIPMTTIAALILGLVIWRLAIRGVWLKPPASEEVFEGERGSINED